MAATTQFNILHMSFARMVNDPVANAATDGKKFTILKRSDFLNQANTDLVSEFYFADPTKQKTLVRQQFQSLVKSAAVSDWSSGYALSGIADYNQMPLGATLNSDTTMFVFHPSKEELDNNVNPNLPNAWTIEGGKVYLYKAGVAVGATAGKFYYLLKDEIVQDVGPPDLAIASRWYWTILNRAVSAALSESSQDFQNAQEFTNRANRQIDNVKV